MNHRRVHPRHHPATGRERSSNYVYPQIEDGKSGRGRASQRRQLPAPHMETYHGSYRIEGTRLVFEANAFDRDFDDWMDDPEFAAAYRAARARIDALDLAED